MIKRSLLLLFFGCILTILSAQDAGHEVPQSALKSMNARVENGINAGIVIGMINDVGESYHYAGFSSIPNKTKIQEASVFEIGSISKTFTCILLADLVEKGKVKLTDPAQKYLPESVKMPTRNGQEIQLLHLANHTSALPRMPTNFTPTNPGNPYADYTVEQMYEFINDVELTRDIGSAYEYSNLAMGLLGHILATINGTSYEQLMVNKIANVLDMKDTRIEFTSRMKKNLAVGHNGNTEVENWDIPTLAGAGAIRSTAGDMLKYVAANMGLTKTALADAMKLSHTITTSELSQQVGLAWHETEVNGKKILWHNGGTGGYRAFAGFIKGGNRGVVVLTNSDVGVDDLGIHILEPSAPLEDPKPSIAIRINDEIEKNGLDGLGDTYNKLRKENADDYGFDEMELNALGYQYMGAGELDKAIAVFKINVAAFPDAFNVYDSMGEAYLEKGNKELAIENYKKSVEINPGNVGGIDALEKLGVDVASLTKQVEIADEILESYLGNFELFPGFVLTISKEGNQMKAQATGQPQLDIFPNTATEFYLKAVNAQITFHPDDEGKVDKIVLHQGGQDVPGKRID